MTRAARLGDEDHRPISQERWQWNAEAAARELDLGSSPHGWPYLPSEFRGSGQRQRIVAR